MCFTFYDMVYNITCILFYIGGLTTKCMYTSLWIVHFLSYWIIWYINRNVFRLYTPPLRLPPSLVARNQQSIQHVLCVGPSCWACNAANQGHCHYASWRCPLIGHHFVRHFLRYFTPPTIISGHFHPKDLLLLQLAMPCNSDWNEITDLLIPRPLLLLLLLLLAWPFKPMRQFS